MADQDKPEQKPNPLVIGDGVPEIYIDGFSGVSYLNGIVKFNLFSSRLRPDLSGGDSVLVARICMTFGTALGVQEAFAEVLRKMQADGLIAIDQKKA